MAPVDELGGNHGRCPICGAPAVAAYRPFCSRRCADVDLSRWLSGRYAIPARPDADDDGPDRSSADEPETAHAEQARDDGPDLAGAGGRRGRRRKPSGQGGGGDL